MDALKNALFARSTVHYSTIEKLYFRRFAYKICFSLNLRTHIVTRVALERIRGEFGKRCRSRHEGRTFTFFFVDEADAVDFVKATDGLACQKLSVSGPPNTKCLDVLRADHRARIRDSLFCNRYSYRVILNRIYQVKSTIVQWVDDLASNEDSGAARVRGMLSSWPPRIYFRDEADVILFKFAHSQYMQEIEKAVLVKDLV